MFCLVAPIVANLGFDVLASLGAYCLTVLLGLAIIQFVIYPAVVRIFSRIRVPAFLLQTVVLTMIFSIFETD